MALSPKLISERMRIAFGNESQETIAGKLNMTQGNVSKLLCGLQLPALDTLYTIAEKYNVSIDWLLGLTEQKKIQSFNAVDTYSVAVEAVANIIKKRGAKKEDKNKEINLTITDPLLIKLINKSLILSETDPEFYEDWKNTKLDLFNTKKLLYDSSWRHDTVDFLAREAFYEQDWVCVLNEAYQRDKELEDLLDTGIPNPFGR